MIEIGPAEPSNIGAMAAIHAACFDLGQTWSPVVLSLQLDLPGAIGLIFAELGFILARVAGDEAEILTLAVAPAARRQGIGAALLAGAKRRAVALGATQMFLEVAVNNTDALALYRCLGFQEVGRRRAYYANGRDALILRASLAAPMPAHNAQ